MKLNGKEYPRPYRARCHAQEPPAPEPEREGFERVYARIMAEIADRRQSGAGE